VYQVWVPLTGIFVLWLLCAPVRTSAVRHFSIYFLLAVVSAASLSLLKAARRKDLPSRYRAALRWIAAGVAMEIPGALTLLIDGFLHPGDRSPFNLADIFFLLTYPLILIGLFLIPVSPRRSARLGRLIVDSAVFLVGAGLPLWFFVVKPGLVGASGIAAVPMLAYPFVTFAGIVFLNVILLTRTRLPSRGAFRLLAIAIGVSWLADLLFLLDSVQGFVSNGPINWINILNASSLVGFLLAADRIGSDELARPEKTQPAASGPLPLVTIVLVSAWLLVFITHGHLEPEALPRILWCLIILFIFLFVREICVLRQAVRWLASEVEREGNARAEALVRHSSDVIMVVDARRLIQFASSAAATALGCPSESLVGRPLLDLAHPDDVPKGTQFLERLTRRPKGPEAIQWRLRHGGAYREFETVGSYVANESGLDGLVINSRDVAERLQVEEQLRQAQKLQALGQLVGGIAHNFNNILTSTMMRLTDLRKSTRLPADMLEEIAALEREARRSADLTKKLVSFGQQQFLRKRHVDLRELVSSLRGEITRLLGGNIQLLISSGSSPEWVEADVSLMEQVMLNIASNARDAMGEKGTLTIDVAGIDAAKAAPPSDSGIPPRDYVCLSFCDTGSGMPESVRRRLFEPFFTTKEVGKGMGMGLAAVHGIVRQHHGWMGVDSVEGGGSTFRVYLPKASEPAATSASRAHGIRRRSRIGSSSSPEGAG
jgi:PAS domain S-box-containing protein